MPHHSKNALIFYTITTVRNTLILKAEMNTDSKTLRNYQSYIKDEAKLDKHIAKEDVAIRSVICIVVLYVLISISTKDLSYFSRTPLISSTDIIFGVIFFILIVRSMIRLNALYVLKSVLSLKREDQDE